MTWVARPDEQELETTREDLQSTIEELESSNEELKASNEEIMSMNEELQSANEELETSNIGQELHDDVGQRLTGLGMLADALAQQLAQDDSQRQEAAGRIAGELGRLREQARNLSLGLVPIDVDAGGLPAALEGLAARTREQAGVTCTLDCPEPVAFPDTITATHLFRIARRAPAAP
jgi:signal transduction histidine kinase